MAKINITQMPEKTRTINDPETGKERATESTKEIMEATKAKQTRWMDTSASKKPCYFASIEDDEVGPFSIKPRVQELQLNPKFTPEDLKDYIPTEDMKEIETFAKAHEAALENIYKHLPTPGAHDPALLWPFKVTAEPKSIVDDGVKEAFFKSLASSPKKARHKNLRLAVLARLPQQ
jgi:hypothetical protein